MCLLDRIIESYLEKKATYRKKNTKKRVLSYLETFAAEVKGRRINQANMKFHNTFSDAVTTGWKFSELWDSRLSPVQVSCNVKFISKWREFNNVSQKEHARSFFVWTHVYYITIFIHYKKQALGRQQSRRNNNNNKLTQYTHFLVIARFVAAMIRRNS